MKVIGIDQSFSNMAYVVSDEAGKVFDVGVLHTGAKVPANLEKEFGCYFDSIQEQLQYLYSEFRIVVKKNYPCKLVFEGLAFGAKGDRVFSLGGLFYYLTTRLMDEGLIKAEDLITVAPTSVKSMAREIFSGDDQYEKDKDGNIIYLKSKKPKLKKMEKSDMLEALKQTDDKWIIEGFSASSKKIPTGIKDIPDAYWILRTYQKKHLDSKVK